MKFIHKKNIHYFGIVHTPCHDNKSVILQYIYIVISSSKWFTTDKKKK